MRGFMQKAARSRGSWPVSSLQGQSLFSCATLRWTATGGTGLRPPRSAFLRQRQADGAPRLEPLRAAQDVALQVPRVTAPRQPEPALEVPTTAAEFAPAEAEPAPSASSSGAEPRAPSPSLHFVPSAPSSSSGESRPPAAADSTKLDMLKRFLPLTQEPNTARPPPSLLQVGTQLRVEWGNGWWAAKVKEMRDDAVKIGFQTWSADYDEWISKDSKRLKLPLPDDVDLEEPGATPFKPEPRPAVNPVDLLLPMKSKPFIPKPYNPEKELQKRQMRLRAKVAEYQQEKLGAIDPALAALRGDSEVQSQGASLSSTSSPPSAEPTAAASVASSQAEPSAAAAAGIRWEELLSDRQERYYHEVATGKTQWELPTEGWVELVADDGGRYYWDPATNTTQWDRPGS